MTQISPEVWQKIEARQAYFDELEAAGKLAQNQLAEKVIAGAIAATATMTLIQRPTETIPAQAVTAVEAVNFDQTNDIKPSQEEVKVDYLKPAKKPATKPQTKPTPPVESAPKPKTSPLEEYISKYKDLIETEAAITGAPAQFLMGQTAHESNNGKASLFKKYNNPAGVKAGPSWKGDLVKLPTSEFRDGKWVKETAKFRRYDSIEAGFKDYAENVIASGYFKDAAKETNPYKAAERLTDNNGPKYATDKDYEEKLKTMIDQVIDVYKPTPVVPVAIPKSIEKPTPTEKAKPIVKKLPKPKVTGDKVVDADIVYFSQHDKEWKNELYTVTGNENQTIASSGCGPTAEAMVISTLTGEKVTPEEMADWNEENGYRTANSGTAHASFEAAAEAHGLETDKIAVSKKAIDKATEKGGLVIVSGRDTNLETPATSAGHIFVITDIQGKNAIVADPNAKEKAPTKMPIKEALSGLRSAVAVFDTDEELTQKENSLKN